MIDAVSETSRLLLVVLLAVGLSGCQTVRGMLKPYVCDCSTGVSNTTAQNCPAPTDADATGAASALAMSKDTAATAVELARAEARLAAETEKPSIRTLERRKRQEPQLDPLETINPIVSKASVDTTDASQTDRLQETFGVALPEADQAVVLTGNFSKQEGNELVVVRPGKHLSVYSAEERIARLDLAGEAAPKEFGEMGIDTTYATAQAVRMVEDGTLQVLMHWREQSEDGEISYKVGLYKVIGPFVGRLFERTLAVGKDDEDELVRRGAYEVLRGDSHRFLRWIPADDSGQLLTEQAVVLKWNRWEGVYRKPTIPPTAPKRDKLQSMAPAGTAAATVVQR
ncbi:hypothetical protein FIV42_04085 [Persicimonas caeni]|uniref:Uncharacterized protein n=1 Tax=Persicimonas caeni TaxID=2292766 RepID=A0A4Y6PNQ4_PERCE|nr:hypothetical protein [Persicimonas caeni]QDG49946.1 hypothetical protein FIV42_04085 [Persicimonas caeni]QED31167.1 hypothetical protein FRD00_04080 [Persicimonas caeni]